MGRNVAQITIATAGGVLTGPGCPSVKVDGKIISVLGDSVQSHGSGSHVAATITSASSSVFAGGMAVVRNTDSASCGDIVTNGNTTVKAGD